MTRKLYLIAIALIASAYAATAQPSERLRVLDSLTSALQASQRNDKKLEILNQICDENFNIDTTMKYAEAMRAIAQRSIDKPMEVRALRYLADCYYNNEEYGEAMKLLSDEAIPMAQSEKCLEDLGICYVIFGNCASYTKKGTNGNQWYDKGIDIFRSLGNYKRMIWAFNIKATTYIEDGLLNYGQTYLDSSMKYAEIVNDKYSNADIHYYQAYLLSYDSESSVDNRNKIIATCESELEFLKSVYKYEDVVWNCGVMADLLMMNAEEAESGEEAQGYLDKCGQLLDMYAQYESEIGYNIEPINKHEIKYLIVSGQYDKVLEALQQARQDMEDVGDDNFLISAVYGLYRQYYERTGDFQKALAYADSLQSLESASENINLAVGDTQKDYEEQMAVQDAKHEAELRMHWIIMWFIIGLFVLMIGFIIYVVRTSIQRRELNSRLASQNEELQQQREELHAQNDALNEKNAFIEEQNKEIEAFNTAMVSSLKYAKRIQTAAMPSQENMRSIFGDYLFVFRPFNIVSGDYMWATQKGKYKLLVVADCTGHGVPGALLSILGISLLNELVATNDLDATAPGVLLNLMRGSLKKTLRQEVKTDEATKDGMDLALMIFDMEAMKLRYAGAYRPIVRVRDGQVDQFETSKMPIGSHIKDSKDFESFETDIREGDRFYAFSDGITDQFGYRDEDNKLSKYTPKRLRALLGDIYSLPFDKQQMIIEKTLDNWRVSKADSEVVSNQTDDNIIVGIRI